MAPNTIAERQVGITSFEVNGTTVNAIAQPYRFYLLSRVQNHVDALAESDREDVLELLRTCGMGELLKMRLSRNIGRHDNREVWL